MATNEYDLQREEIGWRHRYPEDALGFAVQTIDKWSALFDKSTLEQKLEATLKVADDYLIWLRKNSET